MINATMMNATMKRIAILTGVIVCLVALVAGADFAPALPETTQPKEDCVGYTVVEAGVGVNCHGDTIRLTKRYGYYEAVRAR